MNNRLRVAFTSMTICGLCSLAVIAVADESGPSEGLVIWGLFVLGVGWPLWLSYLIAHLAGGPQEPLVVKIAAFVSPISVVGLAGHGVRLGGWFPVTSDLQSWYLLLAILVWCLGMVQARHESLPQHFPS